MNLGKKKDLARRVFGVGEKRIIFVKSRLEDLKEAITRQDFKDLKEDGAIIIKEIKGRRKVLRRGRRRKGSIKVRVNKRKEKYKMLTRKLRKYIGECVRKKTLSKEDAKELRKKIRNSAFRSLAHLKEHIGGLGK